MLSFLRTPPGYKPADSVTLSIAAAGAVFMLYGSKVGPAADVQATMSGDPAVNSAIKKAGWESIALVVAAVLLTRDINVAILGGGAIVMEHMIYLHSEMASPATGQIMPGQQPGQGPGPAAYAPAGASVQLTAVG